MSGYMADIILIEDNPDDAELTLRSLRKNNIAHRVHHISDGEEAIQYLEAGKNESIPKLILLDLKMPKVDGLQVLKAIKGDERLRVIPVVVLTSSKEEKDIVSSYQLGVNAYIVKPVDFEKFERVVNDLGLFWINVNQSPR